MTNAFPARIEQRTNSTKIFTLHILVTDVVNLFRVQRYDFFGTFANLFAELVNGHTFLCKIVKV